MSILDDVLDHLDGRKYDTYIAAVCIFHSDRSPSLMIYEDRYRCLACGKAGTTKSLLKMLAGVTVIYQPECDDTAVSVCNPFYRWLKKSTIKEVLKSGWTFLNNHPYMGTYITHDRAITDANRKALGIGARDGFYTFPIRSLSGEIVGAFVRSPEGADRRYFVPRDQDPNLPYIPFPNLVKQQSKVFMTFGSIDAISIVQCGFAAISTSNGKRIDATYLDDLRKRIIFLPDYGEEDEAHTIANQLGWRGSVMTLHYPDGCKDPNDYYRKDSAGLISELRSHQ